MSFTDQQYRPEIDGLRAIAILSVIGFHAFPYWIKGGFVGVDVFFVISGYLISGIVMRQIDTGHFRISQFYARRVRRIFPALLTVITFCIAFGWVVLLSPEYERLGKHAAAGTTFIANFALWSEAGYFDTTAETKPFLHLWSLAIEEQFYIFWPLFLGLIWRRRKIVVIALAVFCGVSFLLSLYYVQTDRISAFYSPITRAWELAIGGTLAYAQLRNSQIPQRYSSISAILGFILLFVGFTTIDRTTEFPGWRALAPVLGSALLIAAGANSRFCMRLLANRLMVSIGLISYPLYLWHWPILSFAHIIEGRIPSVTVRLLAILLSALAAALTYFVVEKNVRHGRMLRLKTTGLIFSALFLLVASLFIWLNRGIPSREINYKNDHAEQLGVVFHVPPPREVSSCNHVALIPQSLKPFCRQYLNSKAVDTIAVWGDSSAEAWSAVFYELARQYNVNVYVISHPSCPPVIGVRKTFHHDPASRRYCSDGRLGDLVIDTLKSVDPIAVFIIGAWNGYTNYEDRHAPTNEYVTAELDGDANAITSVKAFREKLPATVRSIDAFTNVVVFESWPKLLEYPNYRLNRLDFLPAGEPTRLKSSEQHAKDSSTINTIFQELMSSGSLRRTRFFDPSKKICSEFCAMSLDGVALYRDDYHITSTGSTLFQPELARILESILRNPKEPKN